MAHINNVFEDAEDHSFKQAVDYLPRIAGTLDSDALLYFYSRFKQATVGPCNTPKPGFLDFNGRKKWQAWKDVENMPAEQARLEYVAKLREVDPSWDPKLPQGNKGTVYVSRMLPPDPEADAASCAEQRPIFKAVKNRDLSELERILKETPEAVGWRDTEMLTPLHWAADRGWSDVVSLLLQYSADLNAQDESGQTALHYACSCGHVPVARLLSKAGADMSITDEEGQKPIDLLDAQQREEMLLS